MLQWRASAGSQTAQVIHQKSSIQQMQTSPCPSAALTVLQRSSCSHHLHCLHCLPTSLFPPPHPSIHAATLVSSHSCHLPSSLPHLPLPPTPCFSTFYLCSCTSLECAHLSSPLLFLWVHPTKPIPQLGKYCLVQFNSCDTIAVGPEKSIL